MYSDGERDVIGMDYLDTVSNAAMTLNVSPSRRRRSISSPSMQLPMSATLCTLPSSVKTPTNLNWLIYMYYARQEFGQCDAICERQLHEHPDREYAYFIRGLIARKRGDVNVSLQNLQRAINENPSNADNFKEIGRTLLLLGRYQHAMDAFRRAETLALHPDAETLHLIGEMLLRNGEHQRSKKATVQRTSADGNGPDPVDNDATADELICSHISEAKQYLIKAIQNDARMVESFRKLSRIYEHESDYSKAIEMLESIVRIAPENVEILTELGCLYLKLNDSKSAFDRLFQVTRLNEQYSRALLALGAIMQSKGDVDGALNKYKLINVSAEDGCALWSNIGLCFLKKRKFVAAIACLKKSVWMSPLNFNCIFNLGLALLAAQQYASAYYAFSVAANIRPNLGESLMLMGVCLRQLRDVDNAAIAFERAASQSDSLSNPLIYLNWAVFSIERGQLAAAYDALSNVMEINRLKPMRKEYMRVAILLQQRLSAAEHSGQQDSTMVKANPDEPNEEHLV